MIGELGRFLENRGFGKIVSNLPEFVFFYKQEMQSVNVLFVMDYHSGVYLAQDQYTHLKEGIRGMFASRGADEVHIMSLVIANDKEKVLAVSAGDRFCWQLSPELCQVLIYEDRVPDFYGIKGILESFLQEYESGVRSDRSKEGCRESGSHITVQKKRIPLVTISLLAINVTLHLICTQKPDLLYNIGDLSGIDVWEKHEYYRIFSSMFLHADWSHLFSNMIALYFLGSILEKEYGYVRYIILYFGSGVLAAGASVAFQYMMQDFTGSVGASGAIYGILGALLWLILKHKGRYQEVTLPGMLFYLAYSMYSGIQGTNIDNAAHIGGLIAGFVIAVFLRGRSRRNEG